MTAPRVTFLVPVRGRLRHVLRLLWHSNRMKIRQRFLIADGSARPVLATLLNQSPQIFPDLDIEHVVYDDDGSLSSFYRRTADAARRVSTPYVMNCGDDDLIFEAGIAPCIEFLDARQDYASCGGVVAGFSLATASSSSGELPVAGSLTGLKCPAGRYYRPRDIDHETALKRVTTGYSDYLASYHNLFRSELLRDIYDEVERLGFSVLHFREAYQAMRTLASGKVKMDPSVVHLLRQRRVGEVAGGDLIRVAFRPHFAAEFERMVAKLAERVRAADGIAFESAESGIRDAYAEFFRQKAAGSRKRARDFGALRKVDEGSAGKEENEMNATLEMFASLAERGASEAYLSGFRRDFDETKKSLRGEEFRAFLREHAPDLAAGVEMPPPPPPPLPPEVSRMGKIRKQLLRLRIPVFGRNSE